MTQLGRSKTWADIKNLTATDLNVSFNDIVNIWNGHNSGTNAWSVVKTDSLIAKGTATNDAAVAGNLGEYIESVIGATSAGTSGQYTDSTSIDLTPGDWDVNAMLHFARNGATFTSMEIELGISTTSGNAATGLVIGSNYQFSDFGTTQNNHDLNINGYRMSVATTTTVYLKTYVAVYTVGTPKVYGRISARRVR